MVVEESREDTETVFRAYGCSITNVSAFKFLGHVLTATENYWPMVVYNLRKARKKWARISIIIRREGANAWMDGDFLRRLCRK